MNVKLRGILCGGVAAATYGMNPLFTLPLYQQGFGADSVLFYRYALAIVLLGIWMKVQRQSFRLKRNEVLPLIVAGLLFSGSSLFLFIAYLHMDAGIASTLLFVYPVMVALIMGIFFRERLSVVALFSIFLALAGIALLYRGEGGETLSLFGIALVMLSSLSYAIYIVGVNHSALKEMAGTKLTFYALLVGLSLYIVRLDFGVELHPIATWTAVANIVAIAILPTVVSLLCTTLSVRDLGATPTAILGALEPVTAVFFGVVVFHEQLTPRLVCGILLILIAVTLIITGKALSARLGKLLFRRSPSA